MFDQREYKRQWYLANRERIALKNSERREHKSKVHAAWRAKNKAYVSQRARLWREKNKNAVKAYSKKWFRENPDRLREYKRRYIKVRRKNDLDFKMRDRLRSSLSRAVRLDGTSKTASAVKLLGCSIKDFRIYLESKFEVGMSWRNYGDWHIDHIMPCAIFDLSRPEHQRRCFHFSNMQPMWARDNFTKNAKIVSNQFRLL